MVTNLSRYGIAALAALAVLAAVASYSGSSARAQGIAPEITTMNIEDGDTIGAPPFVIQMCFDRPILVHDLPPTDDGDFEFHILPRAASSDPTRNIGYGPRIVFQPNGWGLALYPGDGPGAEAIEALDEEHPWRFIWRVVDAETREPNEGEVQFFVEDGGAPIPTSTPVDCPALGSTATPSGQVVQATPRPTRTPVPSGETTEPRESGSPDDNGDEPSATPAAGDDDNGGTNGGNTQDEDDDGPDVLLLALLTIGAAGALGLVALVGLFIRKRVGFDPHKPGPGGDAGGQH